MENNKLYRIYRKILGYILCVGIAILATTVYLNLYFQIPEKIRITEGKEEIISLNIPVSGEIVNAASKEAITVDLQNSIIVKGSTLDSYQMNLKILGIIPIKQVDIEVIPETSLIPMGIPIGIYVKTEGVLVIGIGEFQGVNGLQYSPAKYVLQQGDYITQINGTQVSEKEDIVDIVEASQGNDLVLTVQRNDEQLDLKITPYLSSANTYKIGVWLRDNTQGIGTMTYVDIEGNFGALGHGINDVDVGALLSISGGTLYETSIISVTRGIVGTPGEISGMISYTDYHILGAIELNSSNGIFGTCNVAGVSLADAIEPIEVGYKYSVEKGPATIICTVTGERKEYDIVIEEIYIDSINVNRSILIQVTDPELLELTGGIVQGMSGSPLLQNGKLIGAVTHVFVNDPTRGYGIFIENMLETAGSIE